MFKSRLRSKNPFRRASSSNQVNDHERNTDNDSKQIQAPSSPSVRSQSIATTSANTAPSSPVTVRKPKKSRSFSSLKDRRRRSAAIAASVTEEAVPPTPAIASKEFVDNTSVQKDHDEHAGKDGDESVKSASGTLLENSIVSLPTTSAPEVVIEEPTPGSPPPANPIDVHVAVQKPVTPSRESQRPSDETLVAEAQRKQSLVSRADVDIIKALLHDEHSDTVVLNRRPPSLQGGFTTASETTALNASMLNRKVWVKRPHAAATIVLIREDDMVDEAKEAILLKYRNQLSKHFDAPDVTIRILSRGQSGERVLNPDEPLCRTIDSYYPGGQSVEEALIIDVPQRRTPRPSPGIRSHHTHHAHHAHHAHNRSHDSFQFYDEGDRSARPHESGTDYFPPMPPVSLGQPSPLLTNTSHDSHSHDSRKSVAAHERAMSVLNTGQVPPLPSPGAAGRRAHLSKQHGRPSHPRQHTSSPTTLASSVTSRGNRPRLDSTASTEKHPQLGASTATLPTPPVPDLKAGITPGVPLTSASPPIPRVSSPRPGGRPSRKTRQRQKDDGPTASLLPPGTLDTSVPPINVLIVEDNMINMRLLEQFVRRLGVRWQTAVNGREAVNKWRQGGFHLVLMDIQLPIMSGLEATKEIRRLERVNNIGVFSSASSSAPDLDEGSQDVDPLDGGKEAKSERKVKDEDRLFEEGYSRLFKSPVIIVALTASNLQSDRHEALAAGCNDFLTKPVNFVWFERKVKEWGCMQALIDFDGWRKWKDFAEANGLKDPSKPAGAKPPVKKALKPETTPANPATMAKVPDPKSLDSRGLAKVASPERAKDASGASEGVKGEELGKENSADTVVHVDKS